MSKYTIDEMKTIHEKYDDAAKLLEDIREIDCLLDENRASEQDMCTFQLQITKDDDSTFIMELPDDAVSLKMFIKIRKIKEKNLEALIEKKE